MYVQYRLKTQPGPDEREGTRSCGIWRGFFTSKHGPRWGNKCCTDVSPGLTLEEGMEDPAQPAMPRFSVTESISFVWPFFSARSWYIENYFHTQSESSTANWKVFCHYLVPCYWVLATALWSWVTGWNSFQEEKAARGHKMSISLSYGREQSRVPGRVFWRFYSTILLVAYLYTICQVKCQNYLFLSIYFFFFFFFLLIGESRSLTLMAQMSHFRKSGKILRYCTKFI